MAAVDDAGLSGGARPRRLDVNAVVGHLRLATGLILLFYVVTHFLNHAVGIYSLEALDRGRALFLGLWRNPPMTTVLYGALAIHFALALRSLFLRRRLRGMPRWEALQLVFGLMVPPLLVAHVVGTRVADALFDVEDSYPYVLIIYMQWDPIQGLLQVSALVVAWIHGMIGLHFWLRFRSWYPRARPFLFAAALLIPTLALTGAVDAGLDVVRAAQDPAWIARLMERTHPPGASGVALLYQIRNGIYGVYVAAILGTLAARAVAHWLEARRAAARLIYPDGRVVPIPAGMTVLEASRVAGIPHASICGGRGRCSTCRVRLGRGLDAQAPAAPAERKVLDRVGVPENIRLACQLRPVGLLEVTPLLPPQVPPSAAWRNSGDAHHGREQMLAVLFADLRGFTRMSEHKLPYDVVFLLNRYFREMGQAIERSGGHLDKFIGDGIMALFGVHAPPETASRQAMRAALAMGERLDQLNRSLESDLPEPLRMGIGIHIGPAIVGEMGYGHATSLTAIGDTVNTASRLESLTKTHGVQLIVSTEVERLSGWPLDGFASDEIEIRGRHQRLAVRLIPSTADLPADPADAAPPRAAS